MSPHAHVLRTAVAAVVLLTVQVARAETSPRAATVSTLFAGPQTAVLVGRDRAWVPTLTTQVPLRLCAAGRCDAVRRVDRCTVPTCPGEGALAIAEHPIFDVADYPTDRDGFYRERDAIVSTPELAPVVGYLHEHPAGRPPPPPLPQDREWLDDAYRGWRVEAALAADLGFVAPEGAAAVGAEARLSLRYAWKPDGSDDDFIALMFGDTFGPELAVRGLALPGGNGGGAFALGVAFANGYTQRHWSVRLPSIYATTLPELGVVLRDGFPPAFYVGWSLPFAVLLEPRIALEVRLSGLIVDDWVPGDDVAFVGLVTAGLVIR